MQCVALHNANNNDNNLITAVAYNVTKMLCHLNNEIMVVICYTRNKSQYFFSLYTHSVGFN